MLSAEMQSVQSGSIFFSDVLYKITASIFCPEEEGSKFLRNVGTFLSRLHGVIYQNTLFVVRTVSCTVVVLTSFVICGFCNVCVCVCVGFVMCGCFDNCLGVLVVCVLVFTVFLLFVLCFYVVSFMYIYSCLLLVKGLLPTSENSIAVNDDDDDNNNNNNNNNKDDTCNNRGY